MDLGISGKWSHFPDCIRALSQDKEIVIRNPNAIRPWQHVLEPLAGYLLLGSKLWYHGPRYIGAWNFGPMDGEIWTVKDIVKETIRLWGSGSYRVESQGNPHEAHWLKLDCSKAQIKLGWKSRLNINQALGKTINWYNRFYEKRKTRGMLTFTQRQVKEYVALCT